jgi:NADH:ubiquinone oxidoreductase subunit H
MIDWLNNLSETQTFALFSGVKILGVFSVLMFCVAYAVWVERKVAALYDKIWTNLQK